MILIQYNIVCVSCGTMFLENWATGAMGLAEDATRAGWSAEEEGWNCKDCSPGPWQMKMTGGPVPKDVKKPEVVCGNCKAITKRRKGKCRKCGQDIKVAEW